MSAIPVYTGRWQDHSRGQVYGDTVTLDVRWAGYLIAALSTFIGLVGTALWSLLAFAIHQYRAGPGNEDAVFFQQQVVYRNQASTFDAFLDIVRIFAAWRRRKADGKRVDRLGRRSFIFSLPPLLIFVAFTTAGIFIGEVAGPTYRSNHVKIGSSRCGYFSFDTTTAEGSHAYELKTLNDTMAGRQYAKSCYHSNSTFTDCSLFPVQSLPYSSSLVECPFGDDPSGHVACLPDQGKALQMDTGLLDTDGYLGINAAPSNRLLLRNVVTCSPIRVHDYVQLVTIGDPTFPLWEVRMGPIPTVSNYTYRYPTRTRFDIVGYQITPVFALDGAQNQSWFPVPALNVKNADLSVAFLAQNSIEYLSPVSDPWFSAHQVSNLSTLKKLLVLYAPDEYLNVMACIDQNQICNPNTSPYTCTIVGSELDVRKGYLEIGLNDYQMATAMRLSYALILTGTYMTLKTLGDTALLARDRLTGTIGQGLPDNQWQIEVQGWFETSLAKLQSYVAEWAANLADLGPSGSVIAPNPAGGAVDLASLDMCSNQRIRNAGAYQSFSFLGLMIVICVGLTIMVLSWTVEPCVSFIRSRRPHRKRDYREIARVADRKLQLQRLVLTGAGYGQGWEHVFDVVPVTTGGCEFPPPTRYRSNDVEDYHYSAASPLLPAGNDDADADGEGRGKIEQVRGSPQPQLSRPSFVLLGESHRPLIHNGETEGSQSLRSGVSDSGREKKPDESVAMNDHV